MPTVPFLDAVQDVSAGNTKIPQSAFLEHGQLAIVDQGQQPIAGYTNDAGAAVKAQLPVIVFGDHTRALKFIDFPFAMGADGVKVLRVREGLDPKYVYRFLQSRSIPSAGYSRHYKFLKEISVPKPPLPDQRRIAAILDHADGLRTKRRQVLTHLDALTQSIFEEMFGKGHYPTQRLDELVDSDDRLNYGVVQPGDEAPGGVPLIRVSNLAGGIVDRSNLKHISPEVEAAYARSRLRGNEILVSSVGSIGAVSLVRPPDVGSNIARAITRVPISNELLRTYVAAYLRTPTPQRYFVAELRTVAQPTLNVGQLAATQIPLPPIDLQLAFSDRLQLVQDSTEAALGSSDAGDELFASLQSRAFRGEL